MGSEIITLPCYSIILLNISAVCIGIIFHFRLSGIQRQDNKLSLQNENQYFE